jgi:hypothetical protein
VRGARTTAWALRERGGIQVRHGADGPVVVAVAAQPSKRKRIPALRILLSDEVLGHRVPAAVRGVAGRTAREALTSNLPPEAVRWLLNKLPLEPSFRRRLEALARDAEGRTAIIESAERKARTA